MSGFMDTRASDSPLVDMIWKSHTGNAGAFMSVAEYRWEMVISRWHGQLSLIMRGPETRATPATFPADAESFGIQFKLGTYMPNFPTRQRMDHQNITLPGAGSKTFWLQGAAWQFPNFDNAETFVQRLVRQGLLVQEPVIQAALQGQLNDLSLRSVQRRFVHVTGLTHSYILKIERARQALTLLQQGTSILDTVYEAGYFDQPHLTRALKALVGQTPAQILRVNQPD